MNKSLQPTPPNVWELAIKLKNIYDLGDLDPYVFFNREKRIELDDSNNYFEKENEWS